jgi:hypothetical protein
MVASQERIHKVRKISPVGKDESQGDVPASDPVLSESPLSDTAESVAAENPVGDRTPEITPEDLLSAVLLEREYIRGQRDALQYILAATDKAGTPLNPSTRYPGTTSTYPPFAPESMTLEILQAAIPLVLVYLLYRFLKKGGS